MVRVFPSWVSGRAMLVREWLNNDVPVQEQWLDCHEPKQELHKSDKLVGKAPWIRAAFAEIRSRWHRVMSLPLCFLRNLTEPADRVAGSPAP